MNDETETRGASLTPPQKQIPIPEPVLTEARQGLRDVNKYIAGAAAACGAIGMETDLDAGVWKSPEPK